jgi:hypothetical protein
VNGPRREPGTPRMSRSLDFMRMKPGEASSYV